MKLQTFGVSQGMPWIFARRPHDTVTPKKAKLDYKANRANGTDIDSPITNLPYDGKAEWEKQVDDFYRVRYTEGLKDRQWMEERDRNYVFRLEREGRLDELEPHLRTEVPLLYEAVIAKRRQAQKKAQEKIVDKAEEKSASIYLTLNL